MTVLDEIEQIANKCVESGMEIPDFAFMGTQSYSRLLKEFNSSQRMTFGFESLKAGVKDIKIMTSCGTVEVKVDSKLPNDHISIGRITLNDIIVEDILLDDEEFINTGIID